MKKCIICRKEKDDSEFSDEHVIPDSLGGYYHIYTVCKNCNSLLGEKVDNKLVNHIFSKFQRNELMLKGKSGKIPNPFEGTHIVENDNNRKARVEIDNSGLPIIKLLPTIEVQNENNETKIQISIEGNDKKELESMSKKILERRGIKDSTHQISSDIDIREYKPILKTEHELDIRDFKIGLLKIAYEFAVDQISNYFEDSKAIEISNILYNADYEKAEKFIAGSGFEKDMIEPLKDFFDFSSNKHYLILTSGETGLLCYVRLAKSFEALIFLSDKQYINNTLFCINDLDRKVYRIGDFLSEANNLYSPMKYSFKHFFLTKNEALEFSNLRQGIDFEFYFENNKLPLFDKKQNKIYNHIDDKIEQMIKNGKVQITDQYFTKNPLLIILDEELYIKILPFNTFIGISEIKAENEIIKL